MINYILVRCIIALTVAASENVINFLFTVAIYIIIVVPVIILFGLVIRKIARSRSDYLTHKLILVSINLIQVPHTHHREVGNQQDRYGRTNLLERDNQILGLRYLQLVSDKWRCILEPCCNSHNAHIHYWSG